MDKLGMKIIIERNVWQQVLHKQLLIIIIVVLHAQNPMAAQNAPCIGINHKNRHAERIEQDTVGSFRPDAVLLEQLVAQLKHVTFSHARDAVAVGAAEIGGKCLERARFLIKVS